MPSEFLEKAQSQLDGMKPGDSIEHPKTGDKWVYKGGKGVWAEFENVKTGESTIKEHKPEKITTIDECDEHNFKMIDGSNAQCTKCGFGQKIVWGKQIIKDGKIKNLTPQG